MNQGFEHDADQPCDRDDFDDEHRSILPLQIGPKHAEGLLEDGPDIRADHARNLVFILVGWWVSW